MTDRWGRRLFTTGGVVLVLIGLVHALSLLGKPVPANDTERQLFDLTSHYKFNVMGSMRSTDDFLRGFSIAFMLGALCLGAVDLAICREGTGLLRRAALINTIYFAAMTAVGLRYFFVVPNLFLAAGLVIFATAWVKLPRSAS